MGNDPNNKLDPQLLENVARDFNKAFETNIATEGAVRYAAEAVQNTVEAYQVKGQLVDAYAKASHEAQQQSPDQAVKDQNDSLESAKRLDLAKELYQKEKNALAEQTRSEEFKKQSFDEKAREVDAQFAKSNQQQVELKNQQDSQYKEAAGENARVKQELTSLNEGARQEHEKWRQDVTGKLCKDEATAQIDKKIEERVGQYQGRLTDMGSKFTDVQAMTDKYKVTLEEKKPEQVEAKAAEIQEKSFKSVEVPSVAPPTAPSGPGGGPGSGPGGGGPGGGPSTSPGVGGPGGR